MGVIDHPEINAASAGGGEFYVTAGLLRKASGQLAPVAGALITRSYTRKEENDADQHGVNILKRIGQPKEVMINTLMWLMQTEGGSSSGGFFATHPATGDRIEALRRL